MLCDKAFAPYETVLCCGNKITLLDFKRSFVFEESVVPMCCAKLSSKGCQTSCFLKVCCVKVLTNKRRGSEIQGMTRECALIK